MSRPLEQILARARAHLNDATEATHDHQDLIANYLNDVYQIGLLIESESEILNSPELRAFLDETAKDLIQLKLELSSYPGTLVLEFDGIWEGNEWERLCKRRSAIQFFLDLYRTTEFAPLIERIETDYLDEHIREWAENEGYLSPSEIDPHIPHSHWWWWAPETPPS